MHLPEQYSGEYSLDHVRDDAETDDVVYYPPDGTIHTVIEQAGDYVKLCEHGSGVEWTVDGSDFRENLFTDFFPLQRN